jgi:hypothetical protein
MGRKKMPGLVKRGENWHINKVVDGVRMEQVGLKKQKNT